MEAKVSSKTLYTRIHTPQGGHHQTKRHKLMFTNKSAELRKTNYGRSITVTYVGKFILQEAEIEI